MSDGTNVKNSYWDHYECLDCGHHWQTLSKPVCPKCSDADGEEY